jgi:hypothetical protein
MININFILKYILNTIIENIGKLILLTTVLIAYQFAGSFEDIENKSLIIKEIDLNESSYYIISDEDNFSLIEKNNDLVIKNNHIIQYKYNDINVLFWFLFGLFLLIFILLSFDDDGGWNFNYILRKTIRDFIRCDEEDNKYNYHVFGKLLIRSDRMLCRDEFYLRLDDLKILPDYNSKSMIRDKKLKIIGII